MLPNAEQANPDSSATRIRYMVSIWLALMAAHAYLCRFSIGVIAKTIRLDLGLTEDELGFILGPVFFWSYALAQIPSSRLGERLGARLSLPLFICFWSLATILFGALTWYPLLILVWAVAGLAQAGAFPVATRTISIWYPSSERALASGMLVSMMSVGAAIGAGLTGLFIEHVSWRVLFLLYAMPGLIWAILFYRWYRNGPEAHPQVNDAERQLIRGSTSPNVIESIKEPTPWLRLACSWPMWMICGQQYCRAAAQVFFASWFATFLQESRQITVAKSGLLSVLPHLSIAAACLLGGAVADVVYRKSGRLDWSRKGLAVTSLTLCTGLIFAVYYVEDVTLAVVVISAGIFCAGLAAPGAYAVTMDMGGRHVGAVFATMNMFGNFGAGMLPWMIPKFRRWIESTPVLLEVCSGDSWNAVIVWIALLHLIAAACWLALPLQGTICDRIVTQPPEVAKSSR